MTKPKKIRQYEKVLTEKVMKQLILETERSVAIVGLAYLEDVMRELLKAKLIADTSKLKKIIDYLTFGRCINLCYMIGLISREDKKALILINGIRNDFAHDSTLDTFDKYDIPERCNCLFSIVKKFMQSSELKISGEEEFFEEFFKNPQQQYTGAVAHYIGNLGARLEFCERFTLTRI